jgi:2-polyprenyl-3-methyl-5-hydroxy-6-metoxy-1,4-benzoquinol methylase
MNSVRDSQEQHIVRAWHANAEPWSRAVRSGGIASRALATDRAVLEALAAHGAKRVLDVGCGEGWLTRALEARGLHAVGIDMVPALIAHARELGGEFHVIDYKDLAAAALPSGPFDAAVCNFSLLGDDSVAGLLRALPKQLVADGRLVIQTLHPKSACGDLPYEDGWRSGSWQGCGEDFSDPPPWYFRTLESWHELIERSGFVLEELSEPALPGTSTPVSVIFKCRVAS